MSVTTKAGRGKTQIEVTSETLDLPLAERSIMDNSAVVLRGNDLAYATLDYIRDHPAEWDQGTWLCGTAACFAGHAVALAWGTDIALADRRVKNGGESVPRRARILLGWTKNQEHYVFSCQTTDFTVLEQLVKNVLNGDIL